MEHRMDVWYSCRCCGRTETLIFLEPVGVDMVRSDMAEMLAVMCSACGDCDKCYFNDDCPNNERESAWKEWLESDEYP